MRWGFLCLTCACLIACEEDGRQLSASELSDALKTSQTVKFRSFRSVRIAGHADLNADGTAHLVIQALGEDDGQWWLNGDQVCSQWEQAMDGREICVFVHERADGTFAATNTATGAGMGSFTLEPKS